MARGGSNTNPSGDTKATRENDKVVTQASRNPDADAALREAVNRSR
jgi:hypothetical protein